MAGGRLRLLLGPRGIPGAVVPVMNFVRDAVSPRVLYTADGLGNFVTGLNTTSGDAIPLNGIPGNVDFGTSGRMGLFIYGQSLSVGTEAQPAISLTQLYFNLTFGSGPKSAEIGNNYGGTNFPPGTSTSKPLVEDNLAIVLANTNQGETMCTVGTNTIVELARDDNGILPANNLWFASAPGKPGVGIESLDVDSTWWFALLSHMQGQNDRSVGSLEEYRGTLVWLGLGEKNAQDGSSYEFYLERMINGIALPANAAMAAITGQVIPLFTQIYQTPHWITTNAGQVALAQLQSSLDCSLIDFVAPNWPWPRDPDGLHLNNIGQDVGSAYFGRAGKQRVVEFRKPDYLKPLSASWAAGVLTVSFTVPTTPLVFDPLIGDGATGAAFQNGFVLVDSDGNNALSNFAAGTSSFTCDTARAPSGSAFIRGGLDYLGPGLNIDRGASLNLRDSTPTTVTVLGVVYPTYHVAPHFVLPVSY